MKPQEQNSSSVDTRQKHSALTKLVRRKWWRFPELVYSILSNCDVAPYFGCMPPELRARVPKERLGDITYKFHVYLENFLTNNVCDILNSFEGLTYYMDEIGRMFGSSCTIEVGAINYAGVRIWAGKFGVVCQMSFPEIGAKYALKIFVPIKKEDDYGAHGADYEITTAFAAACAEPRDNARVYMGSLLNQPYILSLWEGDVIDGKYRKNENEIFVTDASEVAPRNYRKGRRIDFGDTYQTTYGAASYRVRKLYRQIKNFAHSQDYNSLCRLAQLAVGAAPTATDISRAFELVRHNSDQNIRDFIDRAHGRAY